MVLLIKPPYNSRRFRLGESLGLKYLAAYLRARAVSVKVVDATLAGLSVADAAALIQRLKPRLVGLSVVTGHLWEEARRLAALARQGGYRGHLTLGGYFPTFRDQELLAAYPEVDSVIRFEGERALHQLYERIEEPRRWEEIANLTYGGVAKLSRILRRPSSPIWTICPRPSGTWIRPSPGSRILPWLLPGAARAAAPSVRCLAFTGPPGRPPRRVRSPAAVVAEMDCLVREHRAAAFVFQDDDLLGGPGSPSHLQGLVAALAARPWRRPFALSCHPWQVEPNLFRDLQQVGLSQVFLGVESGVQAALDRWRRPGTVADTDRALETLRRLGLGIEPGFILVDPETTLEEIAANVEFLESRELATCALVLNRMEVYEGTPLWERLEGEGRLLRTGMAGVYRPPDNRVELAYDSIRQTVPALLPAEELALRLRFQSQIYGGSPAPQEAEVADRLQHLISQRLCQTLRKILTECGQSPTSARTLAAWRQDLEQFKARLEKLYGGLRRERPPAA